MTVLVGRCPVCHETQKPLVRRTRNGTAYWSCIDCVPLVEGDTDE